jgi:hypothetical protein
MDSIKIPKEQIKVGVYRLLTVMMIIVVVVINVQLIGFGTVVIFFGNIHIKSFVNNRAFPNHPLIPVRLAMTLLRIK